MKTSNILLLTALVVLLSALATYNIALKAEYKTEKYRDPYRNYIAMDFSGFEEIEVNAGDMLNVLIEPGDEHAVYLYKGNDDVVQIGQENKILQVNVSIDEKQKGVRGWGSPHLIIKTPSLKTVRANATHALNGKSVTNPKRLTPLNHLNTTIKGFKQDSLRLELDNGVIVQLNNNTLKRLSAVAGTSPESESKLRILEGNNIQQANLDIRNRSHLALQGIAIPELQYNLSEQAQVELSGNALAVLRK